MANQLILDRAEDVNGFLAPGALATVYAAGTSTLIPVYADAAGTIPAPNPIVADGNGFWPQRFVAVAAKVVVTTAAMAPLYTLDPAPTALGIGTAASQISFIPTIDLPFTNVQAAIEGAAAFATSGFSAFGLGITGNAALLANLDATNTGAGVYRFDGTTTGTFPSGVVAGDTGMVELWRQTSGVAMQMLYHATTDRVFHRRMAASTWGTWREVITSNQAPVEGDILYRGASTWTRLAKGTAGQVLQMNSGAIAPEWGGGAGLIFLLNANFAGANVTTVQDFFPQDVTLDASSIYNYELVTALTKSAGAVDHAIETLFGGTATLNAITRHYYTSAVSGGATVAAPLLSAGYRTAATAFNMTGNVGAVATMNYWQVERGFVSINASGTFIPQYRLTVAPGGAYSTVAGSYFRLRKLGASGANIAIGPWA